MSPVVRQSWWLSAEFMQLSFPAKGVTLFRFGHSEQNSAALFIRFIGGEIAINQRGFTLGAPIGLESSDRFGVFRFHGSSYLAAVISSPQLWATLARRFFLWSVRP